MDVSAPGESGRIEFSLPLLLGLDDPYVKRLLARYSARTAIEFRRALYDDLVQIVLQIEGNPQDRKGDNEDKLTRQIVDMLKQLNYVAEHDAMRGGHADLVVTWGDFSWVAEAKVFTDVSAMRMGFEQLTTRYSSLPDKEGLLCAGLIAYLFRPKAAEHVKGWRDYLVENNKVQTTRDCERRGQLGFYSDHKDERYGVPFETWHVCVSLYFNPQDRSGRARATI